MIGGRQGTQMEIGIYLFKIFNIPWLFQILLSMNINIYS